MVLNIAFPGRRTYVFSVDNFLGKTAVKSWEKREFTDSGNQNISCIVQSNSSLKTACFSGSRAGKNSLNAEVIMRTGLTKKQKITNIYFTEADDLIEVCTYNTAMPDP